MAAKKRRRRARKKASNPKRRTVRRKKRRHVSANPRTHRRAHRRRVRRANPARTHARRPHRRRRHRRNPGLPIWAQAGLAAMLGVGGYALASAASYAITQRTDPSFGSIGRNNLLAAAVVGGGGLLLAAKKSPILGAGLAAGALAVAFGAKVSAQLAKFIPAPAPAQLSAVYGEDGQLQGYTAMQGYSQMQAVYGQDGMSSVYAEDGY